MASKVRLVIALVAWTCSMSLAFDVTGNATHVSVSLNGVLLMEHSSSSPCIFAGSGAPTYEGQFGNYDVTDFVQERVALLDFVVDSSNADRVRVTFDRQGLLQVVFELVSDVDGNYYGEFSSVDDGINRIWLRLVAEADERVYGGGEQFSYFNMRGRTFPIWIQEQGVGRDKNYEITFLADQRDGGGGDYYTTYWAQPTFLSSRKYYAHFTTNAYSEFDFRSSAYHEIQLWGDSPGRVYFFTGATYVELVEQMTAYLGRQPMPPEWVYNGTIIGVQGGTDLMLEYLALAEAHGIRVSGIWIQDWAGRITTSFGRRLFWNWEWDPEQYPNLDQVIVDLKKRGIRILVYANPNLNREGSLYQEAAREDYLIKNTSGDPYIVDYGEFFCGIVDFTNPDAAQWYKDRIIKQNMLDLGIGGWMADFGEYLPIDAVFHSGAEGTDIHNKWPAIWAQVNREGVEEAGQLGEILFWMRAGYTGSQEFSVMTWAGDQFVDYGLADGIASVIPGALSLGISGYGMNHFDIGGYTSLFDVTRTEELFLRYAEMAAFTTMMRTHEGNRPDENWQFYSSSHTMYEFARHTEIYVALNDYVNATIRENHERGIPVQRPLFLHFEQDETSYDIQYQYMFGNDLLVAPVYEQGVESWEVYLPPENWVFLWDETITSVGGETVTVPAPMGNIPVFFRSASPWADTFRSLRQITAVTVPPPTATSAPFTTDSVGMTTPSMFFTACAILAGFVVRRSQK
ncbi:sulfoquinovosidase-like [Diadema antillarum]|uniref:sulfoquinovosidase-like n=1 Tax=Diadema antillarum TaxID=105358 RepID=UPI003A8B0CE8